MGALGLGAGPGEAGEVLGPFPNGSLLLLIRKSLISCDQLQTPGKGRERMTPDLKNLKTCRDIVDPIITEYGGRIFHTAGDSVIAEFASPGEINSTFDET